MALRSGAGLFATAERLRFPFKHLFEWCVCWPWRTVFFLLIFLAHWLCSRIPRGVGGATVTSENEKESPPFESDFMAQASQESRQSNGDLDAMLTANLNSMDLLNNPELEHPSLTTTRSYFKTYVATAFTLWTRYIFYTRGSCFILLTAEFRNLTPDRRCLTSPFRIGWDSPFSGVPPYLPKTK